MESSTLQVKCSGCGKVEKPGEKKFQACSKCIKVKMLPNIYCSDECFRLDWKTHKKKHGEFSSKRNEYKCHNTSRENIKVFTSLYRNTKRQAKKSKDKYTEFISMMYAIQAARAEMNYDKAETLCRKVINMYQFVPGPYKELAFMKYSTNKSSPRCRLEAARLLELSMEKNIHLLLNGDTKVKRMLGVGPLETTTDQLSYPCQCQQFLENMELIFEMQNGLKNDEEAGASIFEASWILDDQKFMRLGFFALEIVTDDDLYKTMRTIASRFHAVDVPLEYKHRFSEFCLALDQDVEFYNTNIRIGMVCHGLFHNGILSPDVEISKDLFNNRNRDELTLALTAYKNAHRIGTGYQENKDKNEKYYKLYKAAKTAFVLSPTQLVEDYLTPLTTLLDIETNESANDSDLTSPFFDGEWVIAHGLTSIVGKTLNQTAAMVKSDRLNEEGRVTVVFKERGPVKYLKVENLKRAVKLNRNYALLVCLTETDQWKFMMKENLVI